MDNLGAIGGPLLALGLVSLVGVRSAILLSVIPGLLAAMAIVYAIRQAHLPKVTVRRKLRFQVRPVLRGQLGRILAGFTAFGIGNVAATLLIPARHRPVRRRTRDRGRDPARDRPVRDLQGGRNRRVVPRRKRVRPVGAAGPLLVILAGVAAFAVAYLLFAVSGPALVLLDVAFALAGVGIGCAETAEHAAVAAAAVAEIRGSAFGLLATVQAGGNVAASAIAGLLYTFASPAGRRPVPARTTCCPRRLRRSATSPARSWWSVGSMTGNWESPGGRIEVGESAAQVVIREVAEESGVSIALTGLSGVYSDPTHVLLDPDGTVHQQLALCFHAVPATLDSQEPRPDGIETNAAAWCDPGALGNLVMHPAMRRRLHDAVAGPLRAHFE